MSRAALDHDISGAAVAAVRGSRKRFDVTFIGDAAHITLFGETMISVQRPRLSGSTGLDPR